MNIEFFIFIGGIIILTLVLNLRDRVRKLEELMKGSLIERAPEKVYESQVKQYDSQTKHLETQQQIATESAITPTKTEPNSLNRFIEWLKEDWLLKLGAALLLIGFGWLTTYAFLNNWIGPMGRIALGIIAGALFILLGSWRIKNHIHQGGVFLVLGSTTILLTVFAAREIYDFFTPLSALVVMFLSTAFVGLASIKYNNRSLALTSIILAGLAPLLTNAPTTNYTGLFSYLFVVVLGTVWIVALTGRRELTAASLILITFYSLPHLFSFTSADKGVLLLFAYAFSAIFFLTNTTGILKLKDKKIIPDLVTAAGNGLFLLSWIMSAGQDEWKSLIISAWMIVFGAGAFLIFKITKRREPFYVYAGVGIAMLAAATSAELNGATLVIAYAIETGVIALITYLILKDIKIAERMSLLLIGPAILSVQSIASRSWATGVIHKNFFVLLIMAIIPLGLGLFFLSRVNETEDKEPRKFNAVLLIAGSIYTYILLWLSLHAGLENDDTATMISLVTYAIVGLISYFYGLLNEKKSIKLYGGVLVGFVVIRLILVDVWNMQLTGRIITFFLIGALLMSTAFLGKKRSNSNLSEKN